MVTGVAVCVWAKMVLEEDVDTDEEGVGTAAADAKMESSSAIPVVGGCPTVEVSAGVCTGVWPCNAAKRSFTDIFVVGLGLDSGCGTTGDEHPGVDNLASKTARSPFGWLSDEDEVVEAVVVELEAADAVRPGTSFAV